MGSETRARLAFGALLAATLISFELLFDSDGYVGPALLACVFPMVISGLARRWGAGSILTFEISLAGLFWYLALVFEAGKTFYGLPTPEAAADLVTLVTTAVDASAIDYAPIPVRAGYVVLVVVGFWLATTVGELAAFRWRRPVVASLPAIVLFAVAMITGTGAGSVFFLAIFLVMLLTFWAAESSHRLRSWGRWVSAWDHLKEEEPEQVTSGLARRMGASCIAVTLVAPIFLPTLGEGWLPWRNDIGDGPGSGGGGGRVNLLVDIAPQLLEQTDTVMFTVQTEEAAYWRLASLVEYDGRRWSELEVEREPAGGLRDVAEDHERLLTQEYDILGLDGEYLPAAVEPIELEGEAAEWDDESFDLKVDADDVSEGTTYSVTSKVPDPTYKELNEASIGEIPAAEYVETGGPISPEVQALLDEWTKGAKTPFEKLIAIQSRLRSAEFTYRTDIEQTESEDYLSDFLLETKAGFCQQFSTAFALLARELGYPTRVSVGFLPGTGEISEGGTLYTVRGTDAHAWPEVKFDEYGWIAFEPTARSLSSQPDYTIAPEAPTVFREGETGNAPARGPAPDDPNLPANEGAPRVPSAEEPGATPEVEEPAWQAAFLRLALVLLGGTLLWAIVVPLLKTQRTKRRFRRADGPAATAIAAFRQFEDDAAEMFLSRSPAESPSAYAHRIGTEAHRVPPRPVERLATLFELAAYSPTGVTDRQAAEAKRVARELAAALWSRSSIWQKAARLFSIRSLLPKAGMRLRRPRAAPGS